MLPPIDHRRTSILVREAIAQLEHEGFVRRVGMDPIKDTWGEIVGCVVIAKNEAGEEGYERVIYPRAKEPPPPACDWCGDTGRVRGMGCTRGRGGSQRVPIDIPCPVCRPGA